MATSKDIYEFAIRWFEKYRSSSTKEHEVVEVLKIKFYLSCKSLLKLWKLEKE